MKALPALPLLFLALGICGAEKRGDGFVSLFDGKTLSGWEGKKEFFRVEKGAIVAGFLHEMIGYQCDIGSWSKGTIWGFLYDESRRRKMLAQAPQEKVNSWVNPKGEWNSLRVLARGPVIKIWLNGKQTVDFTEAEKDIPLDGRLGLQIHSGPALECHYRKIRIKTFKKQKPKNP